MGERVDRMTTPPSQRAEGGTWHWRPPGQWEWEADLGPRVWRRRGAWWVAGLAVTAGVTISAVASRPDAGRRAFDDCMNAVKESPGDPTVTACMTSAPVMDEIAKDMHTVLEHDR